MKNFALIACLTLGLISCSNTGYEKKIPGSWCEPIPGRTQDVQEIKFHLTSSMRTPKPIIKQWCDPLMTFHKHCSCYSLLTLR